MQRKLIGIIADNGNNRYNGSMYCVNNTYIKAIAMDNVAIVIIPYLFDAISYYADMIDGLLLVGGKDHDPKLYGESIKFDNVIVDGLRFPFENQFVRTFISTRKPILGICAGLQSINVSLGGTLYQDITRQIPDAISHAYYNFNTKYTHDVVINPNTMLHNIIGTDRIQVCSYHHQAIKVPAQNIIISARAEDNLIEAIEIDGHPFCIALQWHPEAHEEPYNAKIFQSFVSHL